MKFCKYLIFFFFLINNNKQLCLILKQSQTVYDRNVQAMTEVFQFITNVECIQAYKYVLRH